MLSGGGGVSDMMEQKMLNLNMSERFYWLIGSVGFLYARHVSTDYISIK